MHQGYLNKIILKNQVSNRLKIQHSLHLNSNSFILFVSLVYRILDPLPSVAPFGAGHRDPCRAFANIGGPSRPLPGGTKPAQFYYGSQTPARLRYVI